MIFQTARISLSKVLKQYNKSDNHRRKVDKLGNLKSKNVCSLNGMIKSKKEKHRMGGDICNTCIQKKDACPECIKNPNGSIKAQLKKWAKDLSSTL